MKSLPIYLGFALFGAAYCAQVRTSFEDQFLVQGQKLDLNKWTTDIGNASFYGRTQQQDWITPGASGIFAVDADGARLVLNTFNPTGPGQSLYGTHGKTRTTYLPTADTAIELTARVQLKTIQRGLVIGIYFLGCPDAACERHDEIDIELLTNKLQPGAPLQVQLNRYADDPFGVGNGGLVPLPAGFDPLVAHNWTIRWSLTRIDYLVDGILLGTSTTKVPTRPMPADINIWGPAADWPDAYHASLAISPSSAGNQAYVASVRGVTIKEVPISKRLRFVPMTPCRLMETRPEYNFEGRTGSFGPPALTQGETRTLNLNASNVCPVPLIARAVFVNCTLLPRGGVDFVTAYPGGELKPDTWTVRSLDNQIVANTSIVMVNDGLMSVSVTQAADLLIDIAGYFAEVLAGETSLVFYPMTPCRVADTRTVYSMQPQPFGPPTMNAGEVRRMRFPASTDCAIPVGAVAYSVHVTVEPPGPLAYMTLWPAAATQPNVSNINSFAGRILTNHQIVPVGANNSIDVFAFNRTDVIIDINGYFAADNGSTGLYYYPLTQARFFDSRAANSLCGGPMFGDEITRSIPLIACAGMPPEARAVHFTATALPGGSPMPFLTVWPTGQGRPNASMLNAFQGQTVTNSDLVPVAGNGMLDVFAYRHTHVVLELNGYFAQ
ncbi:MAG: family 16 glycosylhydrolase [Acidobacteria bacterium]|nr:family 16 glycosylhydrolase [Acidobacteriota bacterium]